MARAWARDAISSPTDVVFISTTRDATRFAADDDASCGLRIMPTCRSQSLPGMPCLHYDTRHDAAIAILTPVFTRKYTSQRRQHDMIILLRRHAAKNSHDIPIHISISLYRDRLSVHLAYYSKARAIVSFLSLCEGQSLSRSRNAADIAI